MTSEVLTVYQQLVLIDFRYPNLSETINGRKKGKDIPPPPGLEPQATQFPVKCYTVLTGDVTAIDIHIPCECSVLMLSSLSTLSCTF